MIFTHLFLLSTGNRYNCKYAFQGFNPPRQVRSRPVEMNQHSDVSHQVDRHNQAAATTVKGLSLYSVVGGNNSVDIAKLLASKHPNEEGNLNDCDISEQKQSNSFHDHGTTETTELQSTVKLGLKRSYTERLDFESNRISRETTSLDGQIHGMSQSGASNDGYAGDETMAPVLERVLRNVSNTTDKPSLWSVVGSKTSHTQGIPSTQIPSRNLTGTLGAPNLYLVENKNNNSVGYLSSSTSITSDATVNKGKRSTSQILALINSVRKLNSPEKSKDATTVVNDLMCDKQQVQKIDLNHAAYTKPIQEKCENELESACHSKQEYPLELDRNKSSEISCADGVEKPLIDAENLQSSVNDVSDEAKENDRDVNENNTTSGNSPCFELSFSPLSNVSLTDDEDPTKVTQTQSASQTSSDNHSRITNPKVNVSIEDREAIPPDCQSEIAVDKQPLKDGSNSYLISSTGIDEKSDGQKVQSDSVTSVPCETSATKTSTNFSPLRTSLEGVNNPGPQASISQEEKEAILGTDALNEMGQQDLVEPIALSQLTEGSEKLSDSQLLACVTMEESNFKEAPCTPRCSDNETNNVSIDQKNESACIAASRNHNALDDPRFSPDEHNIQFTASDWLSR